MRGVMDSEKFWIGVASTVVSVLFAIAMFVVAVGWGGYVLMILWGWFIVPTLAFAPLGWPEAIGVSLVVNYMTHQYRHSPKTENAKITAYVFGKPLLFLAVGYVVKLFM
jgi:hypothetical protein